MLRKTAGGTTTGLAGARFSIYFNGQIVGSDITNAQGEIYVEDAATGLWSFVETSAPDGFCVDPTPKSVYVDVTEGDREYTVAAINYEKPDMKITKTDAQTGAPIPGTVLSIKSVTGSGNMSDSEIIAQLVNRYEHAFVMRRNLDSITNRTMEHIPVKAQGDDGIDVGTASIIIKQQARRIDELERANAELRGQIAATA